MATKAHQIEPAGCQFSLSFEEFEKLAKNEGLLSKLWAEEKFDGQRFLFQVRPNGAKQNYLTSRRISKKTGEHVEKQDKLPFFRDCAFGKRDTIFDGELCHPNGGTSNETATAIAGGFAIYRVFDILRHDGKDVRHLNQASRRALLKSLEDNFPDRMMLVGRSLKPAALFKAIKSQDGEGLILKERGAAYGKGWWKIKKVETHDCIVIGFELSTEGKYAKNKWVKGVKIAQWRLMKSKAEEAKAIRLRRDKKSGYTYGLIHVGQFSGFNEELRKDMSENPKHYIGRIVEVKAQQRFPTGKFRSPRFLQWRIDKNAEECVWK